MPTSETYVRRRANPRRWLFPPQSAPELRQLCAELRLAEVSARILCRRGFVSPDAAGAFLTRHLTLLHDPALLPDIAPAVARIVQAFDKNEKIVLFGDYDADGVTATALLARFLTLLKAKTGRKPEVVALVPERRQGYGLGSHALRELLAQRPALVITLDNGISAHDPVAQLKAAGIDCIVVDHHVPQASRLPAVPHAGETPALQSADLPPAHAVINPKRTDSGNRYPFAELAAVGVAFKVAWALAVHYSGGRRLTADFKAFLLDALALTAVGTIADVVPLLDENRVLAHHGLRALARTALPGLRALLENTAIEPDRHGGIRTTDVAFRLAPRLNAAGRCGHAAEALELLLTDSAERAAELAKKLDGYNVERQQTEQAILGEARAQAQDALAAKPQLRGLVLHGPDWHLGVIGIVASRLVEEFNRPTVLVSTNPESGLAQGSGRSVRGLHLCEALAAGKEHLRDFGGHAAAAGVTLEWSKLDAFRASFESTLAALLTDEDMLPSLHVDERIELHQADARLCSELEMFEPCGTGNPRPILALFGAQIGGRPKLMGKDEKHVTFFARQGAASRRVVGFNCADRFNALCDLSTNGPVDLAFRPQTNTYRGETSVELMLEAFRSAEHQG